MHQLFENIDNTQKRRFFNAFLVTIILLAVFLGVKALSAIKEYSYIGGGMYPSSTITVSGTGEVFSIPDTGSFSFTVTEEGKTVKDAQDKSSKKTNAIIVALKDMGIEEKDIKTVGYYSGPKYEWRQASCPTSSPSSDMGVPVYCPPGKSILTGYEVNQTISVKVRDTEKAGDVLTRVGELGAANISGLDFIVDDLDAVKAEARELAIANAKEKAKKLSKALDIKLVKILSYNDSTDYPIPYYGYGGADQMSSVKVMSEARASVAPDVPVGENKTVANVTITYEIK